MVWFLVGGAIAGAFWGLVTALIVKWAKKSPKLPTWPILTGLLLGLMLGLTHLL